MGGEGHLYKKILYANGLVLSDPVHFWGESAASHLLLERCYPFLWSGGLNGLPFASISCASNQGMMRIANANLCKFAFCLGMKYIFGLPVHIVYYQSALEEAKNLGKQLAEESLKDEKDGRKEMSDEERWLYYMNQPWQALNFYLENLTQGTFQWEPSLMEQSLRRDLFKNPQAIKHLKKSLSKLKQALRYYNLKDYTNTIKYLVSSSSYWTHATWKEFLEEGVVKGTQPDAYRPLSKNDNS